MNQSEVYFAIYGGLINLMWIIRLSFVSKCRLSYSYTSAACLVYNLASRSGLSAAVLGRDYTRYNNHDGDG